MDFSRYYHTLRDLKFRQIRYQMWYRIRARIRRATGYRHPAFKAPEVVLPSLTTNPLPSPKSFGGDKFTFLNTQGEFISWNDLSHGRLWTYNLNYMDFLLQRDMEPRQAIRWITRFMEGSAGNTCGYEPYPIALRGINWIKFILTNKDRIGREDLERINDSLYSQYRVLSDSLEYHLLGNHLLEDGFSLVFAGVYFSDKKLFTKGRRIVEAELEEQVLEDGAHFELSPMYHRILLGRLLDCINILQANRSPLPKEGELLNLMKEKASAMRGWMDTMRFQDGSFPLLNDSAESIAYTDAQLDDYAGRLGVAAKSQTAGASGYRKIVSPWHECFVDIGEIGPSYIPGHAHADTFNFVVRVNGKDAICDTGISTYEKNARRQYERSTAAHNTVSVGGINSSDVWGGFRAGRKAHVRILKDSPREITAEHDGYHHIGAIHRRQWFFGEDRIEITDTVDSRTEPTECFAVFNLCGEFYPQENGFYSQDIRISFENAGKTEWLAEKICREYNEFIEIKKLKVHFRGTLKTLIEKP